MVEGTTNGNIEAIVKDRCQWRLSLLKSIFLSEALERKMCMEKRAQRALTTDSKRRSDRGKIRDSPGYMLERFVGYFESPAKFWMTTGCKYKRELLQKGSLVSKARTGNLSDDTRCSTRPSPASSTGKGDSDLCLVCSLGGGYFCIARSA